MNEKAIPVCILTKQLHVLKATLSMSPEMKKQKTTMRDMYRWSTSSVMYRRTDLLGREWITSDSLSPAGRRRLKVLESIMSGEPGNSPKLWPRRFKDSEYACQIRQYVVRSTYIEG